jgi:hypothetical protein
MCHMPLRFTRTSLDQNGMREEMVRRWRPLDICTLGVRSLCVAELHDLGAERHSRARDVLAVGQLILAPNTQDRHADRESPAARDGEG